MANDQRRRDKKRRKEEKKKKQTIAYVNEQTRLAKLAARPIISIDPRGGDPVFVKRVQEAAADVPLEESSGCPRQVSTLLELNMTRNSNGTTHIVRIEEGPPLDRSGDQVARGYARVNEAADYVGEAIFSRLPPAYQQRLLPEYMYWPRLTPNGIRISFGFMERQLQDTGACYYSKHSPTVTINGAQWIMGYSTHAIERILERSNFENHPTFSNYKNCAYFLRECTYFQAVELADGAPAVRAFMTESIVSSERQFDDHIKLITGQADIRQRTVRPAYVLGYFPVACMGRFAKATTMLYPGYNGTPEDGLVRSAKIPQADRERLLSMASSNNRVRVTNDGRHEAIRWYHDHGIPQVICPPWPLFKNDPMNY